MKRKGPAPVVAADLPPELVEFRWTDWTSEHDPPPWDPAKQVTCTEHKRLGCAPCGVNPLMWSIDQRYSEMAARYHRAVVAWSFKHNMTSDEFYYVLQGGAAGAAEMWGDVEELITG
jgi:hypothetical protein